MVLLIFFIINPLTIVYDVGFHLSFLSIVALVYVLPIIQRYVKHQNEKINLMINVFNATISITVLLLPYLVYRFSEFNVLSVIFNIFLIPLSGLILSAAFVTAMVSF
jgi:competence protein ComEC